MSAEITDTADGILTIRLTGKLTQPDLAAAQQHAAEILQKQRKNRVLVLAAEFEGWEKGGDWNDLSFQIENDQFIEKLAIVGQRKWEALALLFVAKGLRKFPIEFFPPEQVAEAKAWLMDVT